MTLPYERTNAVLSTRVFLLQLATQPGRINKRDVRAAARGLLKHYPTAFDLRAPSKSLARVVDKLPANASFAPDVLVRDPAYDGWHFGLSFPKRQREGWKRCIPSTP